MRYGDTNFQIRRSSAFGNAKKQSALCFDDAVPVIALWKTPLCVPYGVYMVYTWYNVHFKVHISIADVAKDTSFHCFENVRVSTTRICSKRWRYPFKKIIRFEIIAGPNREGTVRCSRCYTTFVWSILSCFSRYFERLQRTYCVSSRFLKQFPAKFAATKLSAYRLISRYAIR